MRLNKERNEDISYIQETIAAIATPVGKGGVGIIRISGNQAYSIAKYLLKKELKPRYATLGNFIAGDDDNNVIDTGLALYFPGPNSFTGEDIIELHAHGSPIVLDILLKQIVDLGGRLARPGEFSERAFLNGKIDLLQAEAIADLIDSGSKQAAKAAVLSLQGLFSEKINELLQQIINLRIFVEAAIDFPDEEIDFLSDSNVLSKLETILEKIREIKKIAHQGRILKEGLNIVIIGKPNAGKSSLLNQLCGFESAIVTDIPGTTRDILREFINVDGLPLHIIDTAGLRKSTDVIEQEGIKRAYKEIEQADHVLFIVDSTKEIIEEYPKEKWLGVLKNKPLTIIRNKIDLTNETPEVIYKEKTPIIKLSAKEGIGINLLREYLKNSIGYHIPYEGQITARARHIEALTKAESYLEHGYTQLKYHKAGELLAADLFQAQLALSEITGIFTSDDLLGKIFSSFCIGK